MSQVKAATTTTARTRK